MARFSGIRRAVSVAAAAALLGLVLAAPSASAYSGHVFSTSFAGSGASALAAPKDVAVDQSTGDVYVANSPTDEQQTITVNATGGTYTLTFKGDTTAPIAFDASADDLSTALEALPSIGNGGPGGVSVTGPAGGPYAVEFHSVYPTPNLGGADQPQITADGFGLSGGAATVDVTTTHPGSSANDVVKFDSSGHFILVIGKGVDQTTGGYLCTAASGDVCQAGTAGNEPGALLTPAFVAVDNSGGLSAGDLYVVGVGDNNTGSGSADGKNVSKFDSAGHLITTFGVGGQLPVFDAGFIVSLPAGIAVDQSGDLLVSDYRGHVVRFGQFGSFTSASNPFGSNSFNSVSIRIAATAPGGDLYASAGGEFPPPGFLPGVHEFTSTGADLGVLTGPGFAGPATALARDPANGQLYVADNGNVIRHYSAACDPADGPCTPTDSFGAADLGSATGLAVDASSGVLYAADPANSRVDVFTPTPFLPDVSTGAATNPTATAATLNGHLDPAAAGDITACHFEYGTDTTYGTSVPCAEGNSFSGPSDVHADFTGLATETTYHYRLVVANANGTAVSHDATFTPHFVIGLSTDPPSGVSGSGATLNGSLLGDGTDTHYYFEWGKDTSYGHTSVAPPGIDLPSPSGPSATPLSFDLSGLSPNTTYHYRIVASNGSGTSYGDDRSFTTPPNLPQVRAESISDVHSDTAVVHGQVNPGAGDTVYHAEYVDDANFQSSGFANAVSTPMLNGHAGEGSTFVGATVSLHGLAPGTTYHYRLVAQNVSGTTPGSDRTFTTFPYTPLINDPCANAHLRQQTGAALLLDCRAYELVSAANTGGYDVESNLIPGQTPFGGYPNAEGQVLYGVHNGGIPGTGNPTNNGVDPYVATRGADGWSTKYVGIPANNPNASGPFASTLAAADQGLNTFAFAGPDICNPCFADGSQGIPVHMPDGSLTQGMAGSGNVTDPVSSGEVRKPLSADGSHLLFGSEQRFEPAGNPDNGNLTIYSRDLKAANPTTEVVSTDTSGNAIADGSNVAELDVSNDGQRTVIGDLVNTDSAGNRYYHLYLHVAGNPDSIDLTPGTPDGALYDGMSADGTKLYFTTKDVPTGASDGDTSADIYRADVTNSAATLTRVSTGSNGTGDTDICDPVADSANKHWNTVGANANCDAVAIGGGGGVASGNGSIYFLSPEQLDGSNGAPDQPNLYLARPGSAPHFVATLESVLTGSQPPKLRRTFDHNFGSFTDATGLAVDHSDGSVYVLDAGTNTVQKYDSSGNLVTSFGDTSPSPDGHLAGTATPATSFAEFPPLGLPTQLAVDQSNGDLYVPDLFNGALDKFDSSGNYLSQISGLTFPTGVAVDPVNGDVYISSFFGTVNVFDSSGNPVSSFSATGLASSLAVDSAGTVYVTQSGGETDAYNSSGNFVRKLDPNPSQSVAVDSSNDDVYVDEGPQIVQFDSSGKQLATLVSHSGDLSGSVGLTVDPRGRLYASNSSGASVAVFLPSLAPTPLIDNPAVLHAVDAAGARNTADFQVTPSGNDAVFNSTQSLTGSDNAGHSELYRYDATAGGGAGKLDCVSCTLTGAPSTADATLASNGLSLSGDGRVFFTTADALVNSDTDNRKDAYEWSNGKLALISAGTSPFDSGLLGASTDGTDAYFFTRDSLAPQDKNGATMKIYDARAGGGFPFVAAGPPCQASDECHGAGSTPPAPVPVGSIAGIPAQLQPPPKGCRKGRVKRHGRCVVAHHHKRRHHKRANANRGGAK